MLGFESLRAHLRARPGHRSLPALGRVFVVPVGAMLGDTAACSGANSARLMDATTARRSTSTKCPYTSLVIVMLAGHAKHVDMHPFS